MHSLRTTTALPLIHFILLLSPLPTNAQSSKYWINTIPEYSQLPTCAEQPLSTIVRGQASGCGMSASYSCFCTASSSSISSVITREVMKTCAGQNQTGALSAAQAQATSAILVFDEYCRQGVKAVSATATTIIETTASTFSTTAAPTVTTPTPTSSLPPAASPAPAPSSRTTAIAAGISAPLGLALILSLLWLTLSRRRRASSRKPNLRSPPSPAETREHVNHDFATVKMYRGPAQELPGSQTEPYELKQGNTPVELPNDSIWRRVG